MKPVDVCFCDLPEDVSRDDQMHWRQCADSFFNALVHADGEEAVVTVRAAAKLQRKATCIVCVA